MVYAIFFYSADREEPIHYHVSKVNDYNNYSKIWIKDGDVILEHKFLGEHNGLRSRSRHNRFHAESLGHDRK
jgi:hypothetical protein